MEQRQAAHGHIAGAHVQHGGGRELGVAGQVRVRELGALGRAGGFMGAGIAESASIAGVPVIIRELPEFIDAARAGLEKSLDGAVM